MAQFRINYVSDAVKDAMDLFLLLPQAKHVRSAQSPELKLSSFQKDYPVLLLLHDEASSPRELLSMTRLAKFADDHGVAIALPQGLLSWYSDYAVRDRSNNTTGTGNDTIEAGFTEMRYEQYTLETLRYLRWTFPISGDRAKTYIGGVGMGGFGALKLAMKHPDLFSAVFTLNGDVDLQQRMDQEPGRKEQFDAVFGGCKAEGENDLPARCAEMAGKADAPRLLQLWSPEGIRGGMNRALAQKLEGAYPGYSKEELARPWDWDTIDEALNRAIGWL